MHAEQRAIMDALRQHPDQLQGSTLYYMGLLPDDSLRTDGGEMRLYCTLCTKMMFDVGIAHFILKTHEGAVCYPRDEYVHLSFAYRQHR